MNLLYYIDLLKLNLKKHVLGSRNSNRRFMFYYISLQYTCLICNLFDDEDKDQYHCDGCGICRIGGRNNFFHCEVCNMCLPVQLKTNGHKVSSLNLSICIFAH